MKQTIRTVHRIKAPVEKIWANISKASGVNTWLPAITSCSLEGFGEGAKRVCTSEQGKLYETILQVDNPSRTFRYTVDEQPFFPISNIRGTMKLSDLADVTQLNWDLEFDLEDNAHLPMITEAIEGMYASGAMGLEKISK
jgi:uncharacterized protein YndB with AHSA1/START domain